MLEKMPYYDQHAVLKTWPTEKIQENNITAENDLVNILKPDMLKGKSQKKNLKR